MSPSKIFGYARVSTLEQNLSSQRDQLLNAGCTEIIEEKISGKNTERPALQLLCNMVRDGDTVVVSSLDRLGRSLSDLVAIVNEFQRKNVQFKSLREQIDLTTAVGNLHFQIFATFAEFERNLIRERTIEGLKAARARGRKGGRKPALNEIQIRQIQAMYDSKKCTVQEIANTFSVSRKTIYAYLKLDKKV